MLCYCARQHEEENISVPLSPQGPRLRKLGVDIQRGKGRGRREGGEMDRDKRRGKMRFSAKKEIQTPVVFKGGKIPCSF